MKFISHRGNLMGSNPLLENEPSYINIAIEKGYDVEIDIWYVNGNFFLGHDEPQYKLPESYFHEPALWFHCKNVEALAQIQLEERTRNCHIKYFFHDTDDVTLTSNQMIWTYPGKMLVTGAIAVLPEVAYDGNLWDCYAICTDNVYEYERIYENRNTDKWPTSKLS